MTNVIFNSGFIGFLICVLLFAVSTAALAREVLDGSLPDALGRPVDHSGGGRRLPSERTGDEAEVGGHAEAAGIPEDPIASL